MNNKEERRRTNVEITHHYLISTRGILVPR